MNSSKYSRLLSSGGVAVFVGCVAIARIGAQDNGKTIHVLPAPAAIHNTHFTEPTDAEPTGHLSVFPSANSSGNLIDHHGPEIANASFVQIYYNPSVANSTATPNGTTIASYID